MNRLSTKTDDVLQYMREHEGISSLDAIREFNATRLSAVIYTLKKRHQCVIETEFRTRTSKRYGTVRYAFYKLIKEGDENA